MLWVFTPVPFVYLNPSSPLADLSNNLSICWPKLRLWGENTSGTYRRDKDVMYSRLDFYGGNPLWWRRFNADEEARRTVQGLA
ncbi:hypothetical protein CDL15_Pgr022377 [Punica granatum]|uniref:Uncharacterized protein n=1 Tax=Punica granatum TaxID=22663 RepID=A0A218Y1F1_PUNGR|nr:hypothetical protein CDL15_Pgr022377 [Punica granatum]